MKNKRLILGIVGLCLVSALLGASFVAAQGVSQSRIISSGVESSYDWVVWTDGAGNYFAKNSYGMLGFSGSDFSALMNSLMTISEAKADLVGTVIVLASGFYYADDVITVPSDTVIRGEAYPNRYDTVIWCNDGLNDNLFENWAGAPAKRVTIAGFCIEGNSDGQSAGSLIYGAFADSTFDYLMLEDAKQYAIYLDTSAYSGQILLDTISNCQFSVLSGTGCIYQGTSDLNIYNNMFCGGDTSIYVYNTVSCHIVGNRGFGLSGTAGVKIVNSQDIWFSGNTWESFQNDAIQILALNSGTVRQIHISGDSFRSHLMSADNTFEGIYVYNDGTAAYAGQVFIEGIQCSVPDAEDGPSYWVYFDDFSDSVLSSSYLIGSHNAVGISLNGGSLLVNSTYVYGYGVVDGIPT